MICGSLTAHKDFCSHLLEHMSNGTQIPISISRKQKSSTKAELVGVDDVSTMILWTKLFVVAQGYRVSRKLLQQDNKSAIQSETNGKRSTSKRTRAINIILYFFIADQVETRNIQIKYSVLSNQPYDWKLFTKPLQAIYVFSPSISSTVQEYSMDEGHPS
jgi:hypothetical protein